MLFLSWVLRATITTFIFSAVAVFTAEIVSIPSVSERDKIPYCIIPVFWVLVITNGPILAEFPDSMKSTFFILAQL